MSGPIATANEDKRPFFVKILERNGRKVGLEYLSFGEAERLTSGLMVLNVTKSLKEGDELVIAIDDVTDFGVEEKRIRLRIIEVEEDYLLRSTCICRMEEGFADKSN